MEKEQEILIVNRAGEFVPFSDGDFHKPITEEYLYKILYVVGFNKPLYIDIEHAKRDVRTLRTMFSRIKKRLSASIVTFTDMQEDKEYLGFMKVSALAGSLIY